MSRLKEFYDKEVVEAAVQNKGIIIKYASHRLRCDKEVVRLALAQDKRAFQFIAAELKNDEEFKKEE